MLPAKSSVIVRAAVNVTPPVRTVTVDEPASDSAIVDGETDTLHSAVSSSVIVSVCPDGPRRLDGPEVTLALTSTVLSGASIVLFRAVTVTVPVLEVSPSAMVSVVLPLRVKSDASVPVPAAAATLSVTSSLAARFNRAVTVLTPPFSEMESGDSSSDAVGPEGPADSGVRVAHGRTRGEPGLIRESTCTVRASGAACRQGVETAEAI